MKGLYSLFLIFLIAILASCNIKTYQGATTTEKRSANEYHKIQIRGPFQVSIDESMDQGIVIEAPEDAMADITTKVVNDELIIDLESSGYTTQSFEVKIANAELNRIAMYGSGFFRGEVIAKEDLALDVGGSGGIDVKTNPNRLKASVSGSGFIKANGTAQSLKAEVSGSGGINFEQLAVQDAKLQVSGSGFISAQVNGKLKATVSGSGAINYSGNPTEIDKSVSGSGGISRD